MKNYIIILLAAFLFVNVSAQETTDSYFANQVKFSKQKNAKAKTTATSNGVAPTNDNFADAKNIDISNGDFFLLEENIEATKEPNEPNHAGNAGGKSLWYKFTPTATQVVRITTDNNLTYLDSTLAVYKGSSLADLSLVGYNDDCYGGCGDASQVDLKVDAGTTYYFAIDGHNDGGGADTGIFYLTVDPLEAAVDYDNITQGYSLDDTFAGSIAGTNYLATTEPGEPAQHVPLLNGGKSVWYRFQTLMRRAMTFELEADFEAGIAIYQSDVANPTFAQLSRLTANSNGYAMQYGKILATFAAQPNKHYFIVVGNTTNNSTQLPETGNFQLKFFQTKLRYSMRLSNGTNASGIGVFRPSEGIWYNKYLISTNDVLNKSFGQNGDTPIAADFDGNGKTDFAVTRNEGGLKQWYIQRLSEFTSYEQFQWGLATDKTITGDFDGDGIADATVIRNTANGYVWYVRQSTNGALRTFSFGITGDKPVLGDFDGDGNTEVAVVRNTQSGIIWHILKSGSGSNFQSYTQWTGVQFGQAPDVPAAEDFDGDGKTDIAVFRPSNGNWYIHQSSNGQVRIDNFGLSGDKPQPADYNGDGKADLAVFRLSEGIWYIAKPTGVPAQNFHTIYWGVSTDIPISSLSTLSQ